MSSTSMPVVTASARTSFARRVPTVGGGVGDVKWRRPAIIWWNAVRLADDTRSGVDNMIGLVGIGRAGLLRRHAGGSETGFEGAPTAGAAASVS